MKVALYVRVSTEEQAEEGYSIEGQIKVLTDHCNKNNYTISKIYKDEGISGKSTDRLGLQNLISDCSNGSFQKVLVWKISRISRKQLDFLNIIEVFKNNNIVFFSLSEAIDGSTPTGTAMLQMMGTFAELERNQIVENVKLGMNQRAREGKWNGGALLGYKSENKRLIIVENESIIVRRIFQWYVAGKGYKAIAHQLNKEGFKTKRKKDFSITSIRTILLNPTYAGYICFNKTTDWTNKRRSGKNEEPILVRGDHEALISLETWESSRTIMKSKSHKPAKTFTGHFPLTTLLRCPSCGQGMIGHHSKKSKNSDEYLRYYQCGNSHYKGSVVCKSNLIRADYAEQYVFNQIEKITSDKSYLLDITNKVNNKVANLKMPLKEQLQYLEREIKNVQTNIEKYLSLFEGDKIDGSILKNKITTYEEELSELESKKFEISYQLEQPTVKEISFDRIYHALISFSKVLTTVEPEKLKHFLHNIIKEITVNKGSSPKERSIKDIVLFFDTSIKNSNHVITYGTVHPSES
ncbi:recombinase family protein [Psychrobacillus sp. FSL K6-1415]|uniref:recombinase family protein n=1 Tax=Psychrobacillus sp. FSL K6-1415 TaxID=2921544 RepID=UPI0030F6E717